MWHVFVHNDIIGKRKRTDVSLENSFMWAQKTTTGFGRIVGHLVWKQISHVLTVPCTPWSDLFLDWISYKVTISGFNGAFY